MWLLLSRFARPRVARYSDFVRIRQAVFLFLAALMLVGCPARTKRRVGPPPMPVPTSGDAEARRRFQELQTRFERDGEQAKQVEEFAAIAREYPHDPIVPHALLYAGMAAFKDGDYAGALAHLDKLAQMPDAAEMVRRRGELFRGVSLNYSGRHDEALAALKAGKAALDQSNRDEMSEWYAAAAEASTNRGDDSQAIRYYDGWFHSGRASERRYCTVRIEELSAKLTDGDLPSLYESVSAAVGPAKAVVGALYASSLERSGQFDRAREIRADIAAAQEAAGLVSVGPGAALGRGNPSRVGALLPLSGKLGRVGDRAMRGVALASGSYSDTVGSGVSASGVPEPFSLSARDTASTSSRAEVGLGQLGGEDVVAVVGPYDARAVDRVGPLAAQLGMPLVTLTPLRRSVSGAGYVYHVRHSAEERARALARQALATGVRDFAILRPGNSYGRTVSAAFRAEVKAGGGQVVVESEYPSDATAFQPYVAKLKKPWQAVFVPDLAKRLQLVAPALAAANFRARPWGEKAQRGRAIMLLSTAEAIDDQYVRAAGRYSWGAIFAPGFYADRTDARISEFVGRYEEQFGKPPSPHEAFAYDAALVVRAAVEGGAKSRKEVAAAIPQSTVAGTTGDIRFDAAGRRADGGLLFTVEKLQVEQYALRAVRTR